MMENNNPSKTFINKDVAHAKTANKYASVKLKMVLNTNYYLIFA